MRNSLLSIFLLLSFSASSQTDDRMFGGRNVNITSRAYGYVQGGASIVKWVNIYEVEASPSSSLGAGIVATTRYAGLTFGIEIAFMVIESPMVEEKIKLVSPNLTLALAMEPVKNLILTAGPKFNWTTSYNNAPEPVNLILHRRYWSFGLTSDYVIGKWMLGIKSTFGLQPVVSFRDGGGPIPGKVRAVQLRVSYLL